MLMKKILFINLKIQIKKQTWANVVIMNEWNLINTLNSDCSCEMSKVSEQTENRSHRSSINKECKCEKIKECECKHEKNKKWKQNERCECEHRERNSNIDIDDDNRKSESC